MTRKVTVLGSTGSIGVSTLDLLERSDAGVFRVVGLSANRNVDRLVEQALAFRPTAVAIADEAMEAELSQKLKGENIDVYAGTQGLVELARLEADITVAAIVGAAGALILIRPGAGSVQIGAILALGAALALGLELTFIKRLSGRERPVQILFINNTIGLTIISVAVLGVWQSPTQAQWMALAGLGFIMAAAQACFVNAMARADASFVTPFSYLTLVFAALYDLAVFGTMPTGLSLLGAGIIIAGAALMAWRERVNRADMDALP
jgi:uncharacterized membrane protein